MHPRILAIDAGCSGGTCPAVYDDDPDLLPDELADRRRGGPRDLAAPRSPTASG